MKVITTKIPDVLIIEPEVYGDNRGFFYESYNEKVFNRLTGLNPKFRQDNHSRSSRNVLRGLHYQINKPQGKLVRVSLGEVFDVAVDLRRHSPSFGEWVGEILSAENKKQLWIPEGFAHGFLVLSNHAEFLYKTTEFYRPEYERTIIWNDEQLNINWPLEDSIKPELSEKDLKAVALKEAEYFE